MRKEARKNTLTAARELQLGGASMVRMVEAGNARLPLSSVLPLTAAFSLNLPAVAVVMMYIHWTEREETYKGMVGASRLFVVSAPSLEFYHAAVRDAAAHLQKKDRIRAKAVLRDPAVITELRNFLAGTYAAHEPGIHLGAPELAEFKERPLDATIGFLMRVRTHQCHT